MNIKTLLLLVMIKLAVVSADAQTIRLSEPVQKDAASETFGKASNNVPEPIELEALLSDPQKFLEMDFAVHAKVAKVCQKKGCFFIAQQGDKSIRVSFEDYGFFVPTDIGGRQVTLVGRLFEHDVSSSMAEHWSNDLGEKGSVQSGAAYEIVASSVRVLRAP